MSDKVFMLLENDEELPSDYYGKIKGIEVPVLSSEEKGRIDELISKSDAIVSEGRRHEKTLEEIGKSLRALESLVLSQPAQAVDRSRIVQETGRIIAPFSKAVEEKLESNAYSIENLSQSLEAFSDRISRKMDNYDAQIKSMQNSLCSARAGKEDFSEAFSRLQQYLALIDRKFSESRLVSDQIQAVSMSINERIDFLEEKEKSLEAISIALARSSDSMVSAFRSSSESIEKMAKKLADISEKMTESQSPVSIEYMKDGVEYVEMAAEKLMESRKEADQRLAAMENSLSQLSSFIERLATSYVESTGLLKDSIDSMGSEISRENGKISSDDFNSLKEDVHRIGEGRKDDSIKIDNAIAALNGVLEKQDRIDQKNSTDLKNMAIIISQLNEKDSGKFQVLEEKMAFIERIVKEIEENSIASSETLLSKLQSQIGAAYDSSLTSIEELANKHAKNEDKMIELAYKIEMLRDSIDLDGLREKIEYLYSAIDAMNKSQEESAGRLVYDIKFLSTSAESVEKRLADVNKWLEDISESGVLESRNSENLAKLSSEIARISDSQKVISQSLTSIYDEIEAIRSRQEESARVGESSVNEMSSYIEDSLSRNASVLDSLEEKVSQLSKDIVGYRQSFNSLDERISIIASEVAIERGKTENAIKSIFDRLDEIQESQRFASKISLETLERIKDDYSRHAEKTHSKIESLSTDMGSIKQNQDSINQGIYYNINSLKNAIEEFTKVHAENTQSLIEEINKPKAAKKRKKAARKSARKSKMNAERKPRAAVDEETIAKMDHSILNALSAGRRRSTEISRIVKGDSKLFRTRLNLLVDSGKVIKVRDGKFVYFMLA